MTDAWDDLRKLVPLAGAEKLLAAIVELQASGGSATPRLGVAIGGGMITAYEFERGIERHPAKAKVLTKPVS